MYALSDPTENCFTQRCDHHHNQQCNQCEALEAVLNDIGSAVQDTRFSDDEERDDALYLYESATQAIQSWKSHQLRSVRQDQSRLDVLKRLNENTVLIVNDWAMKFLSYIVNQARLVWEEGDFVAHICGFPSGEG